MPVRAFGLAMLLLALAVAVPAAGDWVPASGGDVPRNAFRAGQEADGTPLYIIRAPYRNGTCLGKVNPSHNNAYISYGGHEIPVRDYEVYAGSGRWVPASGGDCPPGALRGGREDDGTPLFVARGPYQGSLTPGKLNRQFRNALIPYGGREVSLPDYEVLVADGGSAPDWNRDWARAADGEVPRGAFRAGREADGTPLYVIRARYAGGFCPGKVNPAHGTGYISYGGKEILVEDYEVFTGTGRWVPASGGGCPPGAVRAGREADGTPLYIARGRWQGSLTPGKLNRSNRNACIPYGGEEITLSDYEVLVADDDDDR